jgi:ATP-dependent helicase/nuclease subunit A
MAEVLRFPASVTVTPLVTMSDVTMVTKDDEERAAALDTQASCIVEAPAGSGKTGLLVQRFLKLLGDEAVEQPEEVLAMTFTRKATSEMNERVLEQLQAARVGTPLKVDANAFEIETRELAERALERSARLGWGLLEQPQRLNIRSILSVCMDLTNSLPMLAGHGGQQKPAESAGALYKLAARRTLLQMGGTDRKLDEALRLVMLHRDGSFANCEGLLAGMLETREQWGELVPLDVSEESDAELDREVRPKLERVLEVVVCAALSRALEALPQGVLHELTAMAARLGVEPGYKDEASPIALCADKHEPPEAVAEHLEHWVALLGMLFTKGGEWRSGFNVNHVGFAMSKADKASLARLIEEMRSDALQEALCGVMELPPAKYPEEQWRVAKALFHVLRHALVELKILFGERGECDFTELALGARAALRESAAEDEGVVDVALAAGGRLRHLLVDEMQDTSSGQYELIRALTQSWDGHSQTLFLVGDPKQSVYLFRQARVERFLRTMREGRLGEIRLRALQLTANFRSQGALVEDFNAAFGGEAGAAGIFPAAGEALLRRSDAMDVPFVAATATRAKTYEPGVSWHTSVVGESDVDEAAEIRGIVERRLGEPLPAGRRKPWSVAILGRTRAHLAEVVKAFKEGSIPFRAVDLDPLHELAEVQDALALTRALLHPADRTAWLAVLHAPWCGLGLADLLALTGDGVDDGATVAELVAARKELLSAEGRALLDRAWPVLQQALATMGRTALWLQVERTWRTLGGDAPLGDDERANVMRFLQVLREVEGESDGAVHVSVLMGRLKGLYAEPMVGDVAVEMMTIHKAKGLEWDIVLVPGLERRPRSSGSGLLNWVEMDGRVAGSETDGEASIVLAPIWGKGEGSDKLNDWLKIVRTRRERAEEKRLFYVAATRAREELHLFAKAERKSNGEISTPVEGSLLKACWPAAAGVFAAIEQRRVGVAEQLMDSLRTEDMDYEGLAMAASASEVDEVQGPPMIQRLPLSFDPGARFRIAAESRLPYPAAAALRRIPMFDRPEGSFAVRAFGNVVHRYLQVIAERMEGGLSADMLLTELPGWLSRLTASLRGEGLDPALAAREGARALRALTLTMNDPTGRWILSPRQAAASERALAASDARSLRVDRTFVAGDAPLSEGGGCIWIIDFKTTEQGSRRDEAFVEAEMAKYREQLETYAELRRSMPGGELPIRLGLYYPLLPRLVEWESKLGV